MMNELENLSIPSSIPYVLNDISTKIVAVLDTSALKLLTQASLLWAGAKAGPPKPSALFLPELNPSTPAFLSMSFQINRTSQ